MHLGTARAVEKWQTYCGLPETGVMDAATWRSLAAVEGTPDVTAWLDLELGYGDRDFPRLTPHDLRHTAASLAVSAGANVKALQRMLGHASAAMTLDRYADLFDDDLDSVASALHAARLTESLSKNCPKPELAA